MAKRKPKAKKEATGKTGDRLDGWNPKTGGVLKGTKFAKPPCPIGSHGFHQYVRDREQETRRCMVWVCRLCDRTLTVNRKTGNVREKTTDAAPIPA